ncbi:hypothetical protein ANANG_G00160550, partial [Anguilla anguilla]
GKPLEIAVPAARSKPRGSRWRPRSKPLETAGDRGQSRWKPRGSRHGETARAFRGGGHTVAAGRKRSLERPPNYAQVPFLRVTMYRDAPCLRGMQQVILCAGWGPAGWRDRGGGRARRGPGGGGEGSFGGAARGFGRGGGRGPRRSRSSM